MDLIFFDLDGTLLNKASKLSPFTKDTLNLLKEKRIAHTVATGRTMASAKMVIAQHSFDLPHIYNNGVTVWDPRDNSLKLENLLSYEEITRVVDCAFLNGLAPFVNTMIAGQKNHRHVVFHGQIRHAIEHNLIENYFSRNELSLEPLSSLSPDHHVTNISMIGTTEAIQKVEEHIQKFETLIAYSGQAIEGKEYSWIDVHHRLANKGMAIETLKIELGASNIICFGDNYNDLSMFKLANECYAPKNAKEEVKEVASEVIGDHDNDGVAHFLRERFNL